MRYGDHIAPKERWVAPYTIVRMAAIAATIAHLALLAKVILIFSSPPYKTDETRFSGSGVYFSIGQQTG